MGKTKKETPVNKPTDKEKQDSFINTITANPKNGSKGKSVTVEESKLLKINKRLEQHGSIALLFVHR